MVGLGKGLRKQGFCLDWMLSESGSNSMVGLFVGTIVTLVLSMLRPNYEVALFYFMSSWSQSNLV